MVHIENLTYYLQKGLTLNKSIDVSNLSKKRGYNNGSILTLIKERKQQMILVKTCLN